MIEKLFNPKILLQIEGLLIFAAATWMFAASGQPWIYYFLGLLAVDVTMAGYIISSRWGAVVYNFGHTFTLPLALAATAIILNSPVGFGLCLTWIAHIGIDRLFGFGLKYTSSFSHTHLTTITTTKAHSGVESAVALQQINTYRKSAKEQRKSEVIDYVRMHGRITNDDVESLVNVSDSTASRYLDELESEGLLKARGEGRLTYYLPIGPNDD